MSDHVLGGATPPRPNLINSKRISTNSHGAPVAWGCVVCNQLMGTHVSGLISCALGKSATKNGKMWEF